MQIKSYSKIPGEYIFWDATIKSTVSPDHPMSFLYLWPRSLHIWNFPSIAFSRSWSHSKYRSPSFSYSEHPVLASPFLNSWALTGPFIAALFMFMFVGPFCQPEASLVAQLAKNSPVMQTWVQSLGWEDPLEKGMATHSSILA